MKIVIAVIFLMGITGNVKAQSGTVILTGNTDVYKWSNSCRNLQPRYARTPNEPRRSQILGSIKCNGITLLYVKFKGVYGKVDVYGMVDANDVIFE